jgi:hypothetical protein
MKKRQCVGKRQQRIALALRDRCEGTFKAIISPNLEMFDCQAALNLTADAPTETPPLFKADNATL